jgi:hypothetical protein
LGRPSLPAETCLFTLISQTFATVRNIFSLNDPNGVLAESSSREKMLRATFDNSSIAFVTEKSGEVFADLDEHDKTCLYVQAVAGIVSIFRRLSVAGVVLSTAVFARELRLFRESEQRQAMLVMIASSSLLRTCYTKIAIAELVMAAMEQGEAAHGADAPKEDLLSDATSWVNDRPCKNMGLPWGFTIMALN